MVDDTNMMVSVLCQTYNHEKYIEKCLQGIVSQQTNFKFEILIHDDASSDNTANIIRTYERKYPHLIKVIYQEINQWSIGNKVLSGIQFPRCTGKYIAICEGDDYWTDPLKLQKQVDFLESNTDYSLCFHSVKVVTQNKMDANLYNQLQDREYFGEEILLKWTIPTCSVVFKKEITNRYPQHEGFRMGDNVLFATCAVAGRLYCINEKMGVYLRHNEGSTKTLNPLKFISHWTAFTQCFPKYENVCKILLFNSYINLIIFYIRAFKKDVFSAFVDAVKKYGLFKVIASVIKVLFKILRNKFSNFKYQ